MIGRRLFCIVVFLGSSSVRAELNIDVIGVPGSNQTTWFFSGSYPVTPNFTADGAYALASANFDGDVSHFGHQTGQLSGEFASTANHDARLTAIGVGATVTGSVTGVHQIDGLLLDSDATFGSDDFSWFADGAFGGGTELLTFGGSAVLSFDITTFGEGATAITSVGDSFSVGSTSEITVFNMSFSALAALSDYGDAPDSYGTLAASSGASHVANGPFLGSARDVDLDGTPNAAASGDDGNRLPDDEDGAVFSPSAGFDINTATSNSVTLTISNGPADYEIWVDWNRDGDFLDLGELANFGSLGTGSHVISIPVPSTASSGASFARVRVYEPGTRLGSPLGFAGSGEVEDHSITISDTTLVDLLAYEADFVGAGRVRLHWQTGSEISSAGFNVYRADSRATAQESYVPDLLNAQLIPSIGNSVEGATYSFEDSPGFGSFLYLLEEVEIDGSASRHPALLLELRPRLSIKPMPNDRLLLSCTPVSRWKQTIQTGEIDSRGLVSWHPLNRTLGVDGSLLVDRFHGEGQRLFRLIATKQHE